MSHFEEVNARDFTVSNKAARLTIYSIYDRIIRFFEERRRYKERRDAFKTLLGLDAATLADIGLTRSDVLWASRLPLQVNASLELQKIRKGGKHK